MDPFVIIGAMIGFHIEDETTFKNVMFVINGFIFAGFILSVMIPRIEQCVDIIVDNFKKNKF